jgi:hypothetical protein
MIFGQKMKLIICELKRALYGIKCVLRIFLTAIRTQSYGTAIQRPDLIMNGRHWCANCSNVFKDILKIELVVIYRCFCNINGI